MSSFLSFCRIPPGGLPLRFSSSPTLYRSRARYDSLTKSITLGVWAGIILIDVATLYHVYAEITEPTQLIAGSLIILGLTFGVLLGLYPFSPRGFELTLSGIVIRRTLRSFEIPYKDIVEVKRVDWTWKGIRLFASGGLYGHFGLFHFSRLGRVWAYVTDHHKTVLIKTKDGTQYMLSPEDPEAFLERLKALMGRVEG